MMYIVITMITMIYKNIYKNNEYSIIYLETIIF